MTLAEVAARIRREVDHANQAIRFDPDRVAAIDRLVREFEADPDFTLREQVDKLADVMEARAKSVTPNEVSARWEDSIPGIVARNLRELLEAKS